MPLSSVCVRFFFLPSSEKQPFRLILMIIAVLHRSLCYSIIFQVIITFFALVRIASNLTHTFVWFPNKRNVWNVIKSFICVIFFGERNRVRLTMCMLRIPFSVSVSVFLPMAAPETHISTCKESGAQHIFAAI